MRIFVLFFALALSCAAFAAGEKFFAYRSFWPESAAMKSFGEAGVDLYAVMPSNSFNTLGEPYCKFPPFWVWDETYLWDVVDAQFDLVLKANPKAKFICIIDLNSPLWLARRLNREYGMGGDSYQEISNALCIKEWRALTEKMVAAYAAHMEKKYGDKIWAYMIGGGGTSEWYCCSKGRALPQKEAEWAKWLKSRGLPKSDAPSFNDMHSPAFDKTYFDPETQRSEIEYARFTEWLISKGMDDFAKIVRAQVDTKKQVGSFCGYVPTILTGKLDNSYTYASKEIDFVGSPGGYDNRAIGMGGGMNAPRKSIDLTNKHYFQEIDHRTHTYNGKLTPNVEIGGIHAEGAKNQAETDAILKREFSLAAVMGNSLWCFDMWGGVFSTPETMSLVRRAHEIWRAHKDDNLPYRSEIVTVIDPESSLYCLGWTPFRSVKRALYSTGAPFDCVMFNDIPRLDFSKYKMVVFTHSFEITPAKAEILKKYVFKEGKTVVTMGDFGIIDGAKIDRAFTKKLVGVENGTAGVTVKRMEGWTSVYGKGEPVFNAQNLRKLAESAGVHMYIDEPVPVYASESLVCVHVKLGGVKTVRLREKCKKIIELYTNKVVGENTDKFDYEFHSPDTALFELQK